MNTRELIALLDRLRAEPRKSEWLEFKANRYEPQVLGEYVSALANSACLLGKSRAYLVFGIEDGSHAVVGTAYVRDGSSQANVGWAAVCLLAAQHFQESDGCAIAATH